MQQRTLLDSLHFTTKENASPFANYSGRTLACKYRIFYEASTSSENSTLAVPAAKGNLMSLLSKMTLMMMSHWINSRNLLPPTTTTTHYRLEWNRVVLHIYMYIYIYTCRVCWIACYLFTIMLLLFRVNTLFIYIGIYKYIGNNSMK